METLGATITDAPTESPKVLVDEIKEQIATLETQVNTLRDSLYRERAHVRDLYTAINDEIQSNELDENSTLTYRELSDHLKNVFGNELSFLKEYETHIQFTVNVVAKFWATDDDAAREVAESIEVDVSEDNISWSGDGQDEITEVYVDDTRIRSVEEQ
jgi:hypothetical protein